MFTKKLTNMTKITISELSPAGADLFIDSESYLYDLTEPEIDAAKGGFFLITTLKNLTKPSCFPIGEDLCFTQL